MLSLPLIAFGQELNAEIKYFSRESGLSDHRVLTVLEHSNGFVWVGTYNGLNRFDGYEFIPIALPKRKQSTNGTLDPYIDEIFELENGKIAIIYGTGSGSINDIAIIFDPETHECEEVVLVDFKERSGVLKMKNKAPLKYKVLFFEGTQFGTKMFDEFGNHVLWGNKDNQKYFRLVLNSGEQLDLSKTYNSLFNPHVFGPDFSKNIYLTSLNGLVKVDIHTTPFKSYLNQELENWEYSLSGRAIADVGNNNILFSSEQKELYLLDKKTQTIKPVSSSYTFRTNTPFAFKKDNFRAIHPKNDSIVWLTYYDTHGLERLNLNTGKTRTFLKEYRSLDDKFITSILTSDDKILVLTNNPKKLNQLLSFDMITEEEFRIEYVTEILSNEAARSTCMLETKNGNIWIGTTLGLFQFDLLNKKLLNVYYGKDFSLKDNLENVPKHYVFPVNSIYSLFETEDNQLLIGLEGGGLVILNLENGEVVSYDESDGLSNNIVCSILPDPKGYWLGTYNGLSFFNKEQKTFQNFFKKNGLPHNEFNRFSATQDDDGINYFGGMNGFMSFDPREVLSDREQPKLVLSKAVFFDERENRFITKINNFKLKPKISIPSNNRNFSIYLSMDDLSNAENHQYTYLLEPVNKWISNTENQWQSNGRNRKIQFDYLPSGKYNLRIKGTSAKGVLSEEMVIEIVVKEVFYKSWWFILLTVLGFLGISFAIYRNRLANAIKMERFRMRISSDLHDDVGSLLSGVAYQMELLEYTVEDKHKSLVQQIASSSRRAMSQMRDVVWAIDTRNASFQDLVDRMKEFAEDQLNPLNIEYDFQLNNLFLKKQISAEIRHSLLLIFKEFITNTIKHSKASKIDIELVEEGKKFKMYLKDNGVGVDSSKVKTGQGLSNMKMRAEKIKANLTFLNKEGFGIELSIPDF